MAMKRTHDAVYAGEKYTDKDGNEKTRYVNIGSLFTRDDGSLTAKLDAVPVGFNGWVNFYVPKTDEKPRQERPQRGRAPADESADIPF